MTTRTSELKETIKPTLDFLLHNELVVQTHNQAGAKVYSLTEKGEAFFSEGTA